MTQVFVFSDTDPLRILELDERADQIVTRVNQGLWECYLGFENYPSQSWQARQVGKAVLLTNPQTPEAFADFKLDTRDFQILQALISGLNVDQIAWYLHISTRTVRSRLKNMQITFRAETLYVLIALVTAMGLIFPDLGSVYD
ncbi:MAG: hypothetical protein GX884_03760 [Chloroflexi bacterium]|nr:hypothetical protein [Chloroflexota bacterium]